MQEPDWRLIGPVQQQEEQEGPKPEPILPGSSRQPGWVQTGRSTKRTCSKAPQKQVNLLFGPETGKQTSLEITDIKSFNLTEKVDNKMVKKGELFQLFNRSSCLLLCIYQVDAAHSTAHSAAI